MTIEEDREWVKNLPDNPVWCLVWSFSEQWDSEKECIEFGLINRYDEGRDFPFRTNNPYDFHEHAKPVSKELAAMLNKEFLNE